MIAVVEDHHAVASGELAGDLDRVLHRLRAGVEQDRPLLEIPRRQPVELLGDRHVGLVGRDHEAGVRIPLDLVAHRGDHSGVRIAQGGDRDARGQIDQRVAVGVDDHTAAGGDHLDRHGMSDPWRHGGRLPGEEAGRTRAGNGGTQQAHLR